MQPLEYEKYYHIYNRGINGETLFSSNDNFEYFLKLYQKYIDEIAHTYAWCLMKNHFHFLVKIKDEENCNKIPSQQFSNLFNAYTKAYNKQQKRHGSLFERPFRRKEINNNKYFKNLVIYIHTNPVHHNIVEQPFDYPWSSYLTIVSDKSTKLKREELLGWFDDKANFIVAHKQKTINLDLQNW